MLVAFGCLFFVVLMALGCWVTLHQPQFGTVPGQKNQAAFLRSPQFHEGQFRNPDHTPLFSTDDTMFSILWSGLFAKKERLVPETALPAIATDLNALDSSRDTVVWLGHSSWFLQLQGRRILIDPILNEYAAPFSFMNKAFAGTNIYSPEDMPDIDSLVISHDHWDHLDYTTVLALKPKIKQVICPLGVGAHFRSWGFSEQMIHEGDWGDSIELDTNVTVHVLPARHYSGRLFSKNRSLWAGFAFTTADSSIFFSGDSGYGQHFAEIGKVFKGFDLVFLDCGQYDPRWAYIHMTPEEAAMAAQDLGARYLLPAHVGRFTIANHPWDEPYLRLVQASATKSYQLILPQIGEPVAVEVPVSTDSTWWAIESSPQIEQKF